MTLHRFHTHKYTQYKTTLFMQTHTINKLLLYIPHLYYTYIYAKNILKIIVNRNCKYPVFYMYIVMLYLCSLFCYCSSISSAVKHSCQTTDVLLYISTFYFIHKSYNALYVFVLHHSFHSSYVLLRCTTMFTVYNFIHESYYATYSLALKFTKNSLVFLSVLKIYYMLTSVSETSRRLALPLVPHTEVHYVYMESIKIYKNF